MKIKRIRRTMRLALMLFIIRANMTWKERVEFLRDVWNPCIQKLLDETSYDSSLRIENFDRWMELQDLLEDRVDAELISCEWLNLFDKCRDILRKAGSLFA